MGEGSLAFLRMFRFLSMVRILKLMPDTAQMLRGVLRAIKASRAIVILLGIQLVFFSLLGFTLFGQPLPEFFGTPLKSLNTIFSVFTVENWAAAPEAASLLGQPWLYYGVNSFVILVLVIGGFISLSLANAIFVDEMASDNNDDVKAQLLLLKQDNQAMQTQLEEILFTLKSSKP
jgi:voltage-gated sodium channel